MRRILVVIMVLGWLLVGCAPSEEAVREAIAATAAAVPATATSEPTVAAVTATPAATATEEATPTDEPVETATSEPTAVPLGEVDLGPLLIVEGDLPVFLDGDFIEDAPQYRREDIVWPDSFILQDFYDVEKERSGGGVRVYLYEDAGEASRTYGTLSADMTGLGGMFSEFRTDVGERAKLELVGDDSYHIAFLRCHAVVEISMHTPRDFDIVNYAQLLDGRLSAVVCPAGE